MKLTNRTTDDWPNWKDGDYCTYTAYGDAENKPIGIHFKCPGCGSVIGIGSPYGDRAGWTIDFTTLTASPSILHDRSKGGCGWHGHLVNGELKGQI